MREIFSLSAFINSRRRNFLERRDNIKINKNFEFAKMRFSLFAEILTAFNNRNVNYYGENPVNNFTGKPVKYGDYDPSLERLYDWYTMKRMRNPNRFCAPRRMLLGLKINW